MFKLPRSCRSACALLLAGLLGPLSLHAAPPELPATGIDPALENSGIEALTQEAFYWGLNVAGFYELRYLYTQLEGNPIYTGVNRLNPLYKLMDAKDRYATTVNASTLYSGGMFDVSEEPIVIETDAMPGGRYWSVQAVDQYARWFIQAGSQFTGNGAQRYLVVGPDWHGDLPAEFPSNHIIEAPSSAFSLTLRVALTSRDDDDLAAARDMIDRFRAGPLSLWREHGGALIPSKEQAVVAGDYRNFPRMRRIGDIGKSMTGVDLLQLLSLAVNDSAMTLQRDSHKEVQTLQGLAQLGIETGKRFDPEKLSQAQKDAVNRGLAEARKQAREAMQAALVDMNGWQLQSTLFYDDLDYRARAGAQDVAWGSPVPYQSHSIAYLFRDSEGRPLDASHRYTITFDADQLPPVTEFWELPLYDAQGYLVDNPIDRYSVTSYLSDADEYSISDGKLVFYLQNEAPSNPAQRRNWLPTPAAGGFQFAARFYGPMAPLIDGSYAMPAVVRVD